MSENLYINNEGILVFEAINNFCYVEVLGFWDRIGEHALYNGFTYWFGKLNYSKL